MEGAVDELEFLSDAVLALAELEPEGDLFHLVAERLAKLVPQTLVITISYDYPSGTAAVQAIAGPDDMVRLAREVAGEPIGYVMRVDQQARERLAEGRLVRVQGGMHQLTFRAWPLEQAQRFEERLGIHSVFGQPFSREGDFVGAVAFVSRFPALDHVQVIEAFVRLASVAFQRQRAERRLRESEHRFRMLAENSRDVIFRLRLEPEAAFEYVSPASTRLSGWGPDQIYADVRLGAPYLYPTQWLAARPKEIPREPIVARCRRADGEHVWTEQTFTAFQDSSGRVLAVEGIARDVTQRKEAEEALVEADRRKTEFIAMLSHELRNPLGAISNGIYLLQHIPAGGKEAVRTYAMIDRQISQLTRLMDDLLDVTRITRGKFRLRLERLELDELVKTAAEDHLSRFASANVEITCRVAPVDVFVFADRTRIRQVIDNLLQNAAKFTPPGERVSVSVGIDSARREAFFAVHNTGTHIQPELHSRLFEPFVQDTRTRGEGKGGLGLGLALVKGIVDLHGGTVSVTSDATKGTQFTVRLPLAGATEHVPDALTPRAPESDGRRVLVIEDNEDAAESLRAVLELRGHTVVIASTGPEGIERVRSFEPEVIVCDIGLPGMDGYEVARTVRSDPELGKIPLIALSGYGQPEDVAKSYDAGFAHHMSKPPRIDALEHLIRNIAEPRPRATEGR